MSYHFHQFTSTLNYPKSLLQTSPYSNMGIKFIQQNIFFRCNNQSRTERY